MDGFAGPELAGPEDGVVVDGFAAVAPPDSLEEAVEPKAGFAPAAAAAVALVPAVPVIGFASALGGTGAVETGPFCLSSGLSAFDAAATDSVLPTLGSGSIGFFLGWSQMGAELPVVAASGFVSETPGVAVAAGVLSPGFSSVLAASTSAEIAFTSLASRSMVTGSALDLEWRGGFPDTMTTSFLPAVI
ncbi:hypothetical protein D3C86_1659570 [compost metagenome]